MHCRHIVQVHAFPETANGKLDRKALRDPVDSDCCDHIPAEIPCSASALGHDDDDEDEDEEKNGTDGYQKVKGKEGRKGSRTARVTQPPEGKAVTKAATLALAHHICDIVEKVSSLCSISRVVMLRYCVVLC